MSIALLLIQFAITPVDDILERHRAATRADAPCEAPTDPNEVTVCARRDADRYRVPFVATSLKDSVPTERARLLEPKMGGCGRVGAFFNDCGFVGVTTTVGGGGGVRVKPRELAK